MRRRSTPYLLLLPGMAWLGFFFLIPLASLLATSLQRPLGPSTEDGFAPALEFTNYSAALLAYWPQFLKSFAFAGLASLIGLLIAFPLAYFIAFRAGRWRMLMLVLVVLPLFSSFLLRTNAWKTLLSSEGFIVETLNALALLPDDRVLNTPIAVIAGLTYNFLPFLVLPIYASLDRIDKAVVEAAADLYATAAARLRTVILPLAAPGVLSGVLLTFIPAAGDYINAQLLGSIQDKMIGNVIQSQFIIVRDYPTASALSFMFMVTILVLVLLYIRRVGTRELV
ncbi:MAG: ABC transporter permease [Actinomycetales bacterium]|nr:ABC transporter permease [Actinomycetales bacterium]